MDAQKLFSDIPSRYIQIVKRAYKKGFCMSIMKVVVSDLHLADGASLLDCFGDKQQAAFEGLLHSHLGDEVELIINGDCFDFLVTPPYDLHGTIDGEMACSKLEKILAAHEPFIAALHTFIQKPGHTITFLAGNHDLELCFAEVRERICTAITGTPVDARVYFCPTRFYRPFPDVHIEHGNHYDFWNHAIKDLWNEAGQPLNRAPQAITLSAGSHYFQHAAHPVSLKYPYFDHLEPSMNSTCQIAMLCLFDADIIIESAQRTAQMMSYPRQALANIVAGEERNPQRLFEETMLDFVAFQQDMMAHKSDWKPRAEDTEISPEAFMEFSLVRDALALSEAEAIAAICVPATYQMGESVARGMHAVLAENPSIRYAIAGHTHMERIESVHNGSQVYLNSGSWTVRVAPPAPDEITSESGSALLAWLRSPNWQHIPLRDVTQLTFVLVTSAEGSPTSASLCIWEGGRHGSYRVLA